jgi:hypothetical protein
MLMRFCIATIGMTLLASGNAIAQPTTAPTTQGSANVEPGNGAGANDVASTRAPIRVCRPPSTGAPRGEGTAASRGGEGLPTPILFAEHDDIGVTISPNPVLYFYVEEATKNRAVVTLSDPAEKTTLGRVKFDQGFPKPGIYRAQVTELREPLKADRVYTWTVEIYQSAKGTANAANAVAIALVRYQPDADLSAKIANLSPEERARVLGENSIWYDTIAALSEAIEANPADPFLRAQRTQLLAERQKQNPASFEQSPESR